MTVAVMTMAAMTMAAMAMAMVVVTTTAATAVAAAETNLTSQRLRIRTPGVWSTDPPRRMTADDATTAKPLSAAPRLLSILTGNSV